MARKRPFRCKRERLLALIAEANVPQDAGLPVEMSVVEDLLREAKAELAARINRPLDFHGMYENAIHEAAHAVAAVCLGIGPLKRGIKLWPRGRIDHKTFETRWGETKLCHWTEADGAVRDEIEKSIVSLMAGRQGQNRITRVFREHRWNAHPAQYARANELDASLRDDAMIRKYLKHIPLQGEETRDSVYNKLLDRTQRLLDANWPAVRAVAEATLKKTHYNLSGNVITGIVNRVMQTAYPVIRSCKDL